MRAVSHKLQTNANPVASKMTATPTCQALHKKTICMHSRICMDLVRKSFSFDYVFIATRKLILPTPWLTIWLLA